VSGGGGNGAQTRQEGTGVISKMMWTSGARRVSIEAAPGQSLPWAQTPIPEFESI